MKTHKTFSYNNIQTQTTKHKHESEYTWKLIRNRNDECYGYRTENRRIDITPTPYSLTSSVVISMAVTSSSTPSSQPCRKGSGACRRQRGWSERERRVQVHSSPYCVACPFCSFCPSLQPSVFVCILANFRVFDGLEFASQTFLCPCPSLLIRLSA